MTNGPKHKTSLALVALATILLLASCAKNEDQGAAESTRGQAENSNSAMTLGEPGTRPTNEKGFDCAAAVRGIGGATVAPLRLSPDGPRNGACFRHLSHSLSNGRWFGTFVGPVESEDAWAAFQSGGTLPDALRLVIAGLEADGVFAIVPPNATQRPEPGQAMLIFDLDAAHDSRSGAGTLEADWVAVDGTLEVSGFREAKFGPPILVASIEATVQTWADGAPQGTAVQLVTTLENHEP